MYNSDRINVSCFLNMTISQKGADKVWYYFTTKQYRIKGFFSEVHACVHGADALTHTLSAPFWEIVMLRKQDTLILSELYINDHFCAVRTNSQR
jgi:hypothetical protein